MEFPHRDLYFTKRERHGLYFMLACILLLIIAIIAFKFTYAKESYQFSEVELKKIQEFETIQEQKENIQKVPKKAFPFNPNTTSLDSLLQLPIPKSIAERIDKYRRKGGNYKSKSDLQKIYGINEHWDKIKEFVQIPNIKPKAKKEKLNLIAEDRISPAEQKSNSRKDTTIKSEIRIEQLILTPKAKDSVFTKSYSNPPILRDEERIEINNANEYNIQLVYGIGEYYARKIMEYKEKTGGFHTLDLLYNMGIKEELVEKIISQLTCDPSHIKKQNINHIPYENLALIPEVGYKKATIMHRYIRNHFPLTDPEDLKKIGIFKDYQIEILLHYLSFEKTK
jgi:DNA uptake protein ComE-like DNA-binding protein